MNEKTIKCPICGDPYKVLSMMVGDQSACSDCVRKAEEKMWQRRQKPWTSDRYRSGAEG